MNPLDIISNSKKIQERMGEFQKKLAEINATGAAGGGMVEIDINGKIEVTAVRIMPEAIEGNDVQMLQDLITAAFSSGLEKIRDAVNLEMKEITGGLNIPVMPGLHGGFPGI